MPPRLSSDFYVRALIRKVQSEGGFATIYRRGDNSSGAIFISSIENGKEYALFELSLNFAGAYEWQKIWSLEQRNAKPLANILERAMTIDPDLWIVEIEVNNAESLLNDFKRGT